MSTPKFSEDALANASREEIMSALFSEMVMQQTNMALLTLGKIPHPDTGEFVNDLESAKIFIDQLEMLEFKTKGNLTKPEDEMLKRSIDALRMAFVERIEAQASDDPIIKPAAPQP